MRRNLLQLEEEGTKIVTEANDKDNGSLYGRYRIKMSQVLSEVKAQSHLMTEHATVIYTRSELALEEAAESNESLRTHLNAIHESAGTIAESSKKLRQLVSE